VSPSGGALFRCFLTPHFDFGKVRGGEVVVAPATLSYVEVNVKNRIWTSILAICVTACGSAITAKEVEINTPSLQCGYCEKTVTETIKKMEGVQSVAVDTGNKVVRVAYAEGATDVAKIVSAITAAGYQANESKPDEKAYQSLPDCCKMKSGAH
jgi:copper chaperone CopZ